MFKVTLPHLPLFQLCWPGSIILIASCCKRQFNDNKRLYVVICREKISGDKTLKPCHCRSEMSYYDSNGYQGSVGATARVEKLKSSIEIIKQL